MIELKFDIPNLEKLDAALKKAPEETINEISKAVQKSALTIQNQALREAPVNKRSGGGNLRQNIKMEMKTKTRAEIVSKAPYSIFVEEGTRPHTIVPVKKRVLADKRMNEIFGTLVHHPGTRANPYMQRALDKSKNKIIDFFEQALANVFKIFP